MLLNKLHATNNYNFIQNKSISKDLFLSISMNMCLCTDMWM